MEPESPALQGRFLTTGPPGRYLYLFFWNGVCLCAVLCLLAQSSPTLCDPIDCSPPGSSVHGDSPGKNTGVGCHALLQGLFPTQELNRGLLHYRQILHHLSHQESPRTLEWVAYPFSRGSPRPRKDSTCLGVIKSMHSGAQMPEGAAIKDPPRCNKDSTCPN